MLKKSIFVFIFTAIVNVCFSVEKLPYCDSVAARNCAMKYLPKNPVIIECGGFNGLDTLSMAMLWPKGKIYTFEAVPYLFSELQKNTKNFSNIYAYNLGLGDFCGKSLFHLSKNRDGSIAGCSSLLAPKEHLRLNNGVSFDDIIEVDVVTLDAWAKANKVKHIDYLWLDMQGYELNMLKVSEIAKSAKVIYLEVCFLDLYANQYLYEDVEKWMNENGFELVAVDFDKKINRDFGNALFIKR